MTEQADNNPVAEAFAAHVRAFHQSLPVAEKQLLEQVFALAEVANSMTQADDSDVRGYALDAYLHLQGTKAPFAKLSDILPNTWAGKKPY